MGEISKQEEQKFAILDLVRLNPGISRQNLSQRLYLSGATVSNFVEELIKNNLIQEAGSNESSGGRRPIALRLSRQAGAVVGIDVEASNIRVVVSDFTGRPILSQKQPLNKTRNKNRIQDFFILVKKVIDKSKVNKKRIIGIGMGLPGPVDLRTGTTPSFFILKEWSKVPWRNLLESEFNLPVFVEANTRTTILGEQHFGAGAGIDNFLLLLVRYGIGLGMVFEGKIYSGRDGYAGEIGHTVLLKNSGLCPCGARGCLEATLGGQALIEKLKERIKKKRAGKLNLPKNFIQHPESITLNNFIEVAKEGNIYLLDLILKAASNIGLLLANLVNLFNPERIIIDGIFNDFADEVLPIFKRKIRNRCLKELADRTELIFSRSGEYIGAVGAALLAFNASHQFLKKNYYS